MFVLLVCLVAQSKRPCASTGNSSVSAETPGRRHVGQKSQKIHIFVTIHAGVCSLRDICVEMARMAFKKKLFSSLGLTMMTELQDWSRVRAEGGFNGG